MKKFILSATVVILFIVYSLSAHQENAILSPAPTPTEIIPTNVPTGNAPLPTARPTTASGFKDGQYTGSVADAYYGNIQVAIVIANGRISDVKFLQYPNDRGHSILINTYAMPFLRQEAINAQSATVDIISGATDTSQAFIESLSNALSQAK